MTIPITSCFIAGIPHRNPDLSLIQFGTDVVLKPDPTNQYDPLAIEVHCGAQMLGFIPREATPPIHFALRAGASLSAQVTERTQTKWKECVILVSANFGNPANE